MSEEIENDDQWLYGDNPDGNPAEDAAENVEKPSEDQLEGSTFATENSNEPVENPEDELNEVADLPAEKENGQLNDPSEKEDAELKQNGEAGGDDEDLEEDSDDDDDDDDDVNVVIGDIKTTTPSSYPQQHSIKRGGINTIIGDKNKQIQQTGKFQVEEFEHIGTINGVSASDFNLDALEEKPWRKPGADITDYFNYGFNEDTWKAYCERQKRIRINESGVGIIPLNAIGLPRGPVMIDVNKYPQQNNFVAGGGGGGGGAPRPVPSPNIMKSNEIPKMNTIQVMTADRREYSRKPGGGFPDMSMPPPISYPEQFISQPEYGFNPEPEPFYGGGYEPTQDSQWMEGQGNPNWQPSEIKTLTGGGNSPPRAPNPPVITTPAVVAVAAAAAPSPSVLSVRRSSPPPPPPSSSSSSIRRSASRERTELRERERECSRSKSLRPRDHERGEKRRDRSRSRSRRHKSRSRSPSHRSHKKKKSRRHDDSE